MTTVTDWTSVPRALTTAVVALVLSGCAAATLPSGTNDPHEAVNRAWFERNLAIDRVFGGDGGRAEAADTGPAEDPAAVDAADSDPAAAAPRTSRFVRMVGNFGGNLGLPSTILNDLLQARLDRALENTVRLAINTTVGVGGLFDPAGALGIHGRSTDFGETLHRWGVGEGAYLVLPVLGPTTERDAAGMIVDLALDPLRLVWPDRRYGYALLARGAARFADRVEFADLLDANVMRSSDPYAQARLLHLQMRRYHLGIQIEDEIIDPYDDF